MDKHWGRVGVKGDIKDDKSCQQKIRLTNSHLFEQNVNIFYDSFSNWEMANISEVWGEPFPKKHYNMASKYGNQKEEVRDAEKEGRVFPTPIHRTQHAIQKHRKTIDDLSVSLPIIDDDSQAEANYGPAKIASTKERFTSSKSGDTNPYYPTQTGTEFPYAPQMFQDAAYDIKLDRIMRMIEQNKTGYETPSSQDMMLYIFTGVFFLFTFDTFVTLGKRMK